MVRRRLRSFRSFIYAVAIHVVAIVLLTLSLNLSDRPPSSKPRSQIVQAVAIDQNKVEAEVQRLKEAERRKHKDEEARREALERDVAAATEKRQAEEKRLEELKKEQAIVQEQKREQHLKEFKEKRQREERKKQQLVEEQKRIAQEKALAKKREERQQAEAEKKRLAEEQRKKAEAEKKRKEEERRQRELAAALAAEEKARTEAARREHDQSEINKYIKLIRTQIGNTFNYPERGLSCELLVTMVPGGDVVDAKVIRSSGNAVFDRQAEIAVRKASPLPVPDDPRLFRQLREIQFVFEPEV